ncbi:phosphatase PAP2 family protein [Ferruginibacter sp.]|uniref:phosphatase PAP2 family protein n=1 Tax=Ferruginibacter sp. TaxID=1940288 RepID=UPI0019858AB3|nr:phosphatase PAP2 family protein [Ferruginibacter sp.]MBC7628965.1 phosphatase PAP2 family protein [Ferruginibacter sp.]
MIKKFIALLFIMSPVIVFANASIDSLPALADSAAPSAKQKIYYEKNGDSFTCNKPKTFDFLTHIPGDAVGYTKQSFQKQNLYKLGIIAASTAVLIIFDQQITDGVQSFARYNGISATEDFTPIVTVKLFGKKTNLGKMPHNVNTAFYNLGQGSSVVLMAAGFLIAGKIKHDNRALQTASQLGESFLALGLGTQLMKYGTGRENPSAASIPGGRWRPFPSMKDFQNNKTKYDAFPSGHLATFVSAVTIISQNYPTVKWVKPLGYTISALLSFAMMNNGVHWASDFPMGFALGYGFGKFITKKNHIRLTSAM